MNDRVTASALISVKATYCGVKLPNLVLSSFINKRSVQYTQCVEHKNIFSPWKLNQLWKRWASLHLLYQILIQTTLRYARDQKINRYHPQNQIQEIQKSQ